MNDQIKENERVKKALEKESEFLKKEVIGKGAENDVPDSENNKTNMEDYLEDSKKV